MTATSSDLAPTSVTSSTMLDRTFLYQEASTGKPSTTSLTIRQLVRILCPAVALPQRVTPETNLLEVVLQLQDEPALESASSGSGDYAFSYIGSWQPARTIPVLREAAALWYYHEAAGSNGVKGPVSCRQLTDLDPTALRVYCASTRCQRCQSDTATTLVDATTTTKDPMVEHGQDLGSTNDDAVDEWKLITDVPNLLLALECFRMPEEFLKQGHVQLESTTNSAEISGTHGTEVQDELEAFLFSTVHPHDKSLNHAEEAADLDEAYESDGGSRYVKDQRSGNWIHGALAPSRRTDVVVSNPNNKRTSETANSTSIASQTATDNNAAKRAKKKFSAKNSRCWIYVSGLPADATEAELEMFCAKAGLLDLDPETQKPRIKLYKDRAAGVGKGDASVCFARPESVDLALMILDEAPFRPHVAVPRAAPGSATAPQDFTVHVERAKFQQRGQAYESSTQASRAKKKVAKLATQQAVDWDEGEINGRLTGGRKGLCIVVLKHAFEPHNVGPAEEDEYFAKLEQDLRVECETFGVVQKITVFSKHPAGVVIVKFVQPGAAGDAVKHFNGLLRSGSARSMEATYWDGITDYTVRDEAKDTEEAVKRQEEFGEWIESQNLPPELLLKADE